VTAVLCYFADWFDKTYIILWWVI